MLSFLHAGGCLSAPAEVSTWTSFCELEAPAAADEMAAGIAEALSKG